MPSTAKLGARRIGAALLCALAAAPRAHAGASSLAVGVGFRIGLGAGAGGPILRLRLERTPLDIGRRRELAAIELQRGAIPELRLGGRVHLELSARR